MAVLSVARNDALNVGVEGAVWIDAGPAEGLSADSSEEDESERGTLEIASGDPEQPDPVDA